jgi:hypothetical protein
MSSASAPRHGGVDDHGNAAGARTNDEHALIHERADGAQLGGVHDALQAQGGDVTAGQGVVKALLEQVGDHALQPVVVRDHDVVIGRQVGDRRHGGGDVASADVGLRAAAASEQRGAPERDDDGLAARRGRGGGRVDGGGGHRCAGSVSERRFRVWPAGVRG